jgi:hypothetical protein
MKSNIKTLVLALAGLSSFAVAGSAFAALCPGGSLAAWSAPSVGGGDSAVSVVDGGYDGTTCRMQVNLGDNGAAHGQVRDDSPNAEARYRAQFIFDPSQLNFTNGTNQAIIFLANSGGLFKNRLALVKILYSGGSSRRLAIVGACDNQATQNQCQTILALPNQTGPNRIEFDLTVGAAGTGALRYWVNDAATTGLTDGAGVTIPILGGNAGWVGVETVFMGMTSPTRQFRNVADGNNVDKLVWFDQFDSRRQTFIGH